MVTSKAQIAIRRFLAFFIDWLLIAAWGGALFGMVMLINAGQVPEPSGPRQSQLIGFLSMTIPVVLYFSISEASRMKGSLGKRALSLQLEAKPLEGRQQERVGFNKVLLRNIVKFIPWELGHLVANQAIFSSTGIAGWVYVPLILAYALPLWWVISIAVRGQSPYDRITGISIVQKKKENQPT